jgi:hypothetical protein
MGLLLVLLMGAEAGAAGAPATPRDLPPLTPKSRPLVMTSMDASSSSRCIGRPVTPLCAVETVFASYVRKDAQLYFIATGREVAYLGGADTYEFMYYRVVRAEVLFDRHFPWHPDTDFGQPKGEPSVRVGDARIDINDQFCVDRPPSPRICSGWMGVTRYVVRKMGDRWRVVGWSSKDR